MAMRRTVAVLFCVLYLVCSYQCTAQCADGRFGDDCFYVCNCGSHCDVESGQCNNDCNMGWAKGKNTCQKKNIAYNKTASTTSGWHSIWYPSKAVDGDNDIKGEERTCFHAGESPSDLTVELGDLYQLSDIRVYIRDTFEKRIANSTVYLNNDRSKVCYTFPSTVPSNPVDLNCKGRANVVTIRNPGTAPGHDDALNICEVEIYVCSTGTYGKDCTDFCHCQSGPCDRTSGKCPADCRPGWKGDKCDVECEDGEEYGVNCRTSCSRRRCLDPVGVCNRRNGSCSGECQAGWQKDDCTEKCSNKKYGRKCEKLCEQRNCAETSTCDHVSGSCDFGCTAGWTGEDCRTKCDESHYGINCGHECNDRRCVTGNNSSCDSFTGSCDTGCLPGWELPDCLRVRGSGLNVVALVGGLVLAVFVVMAVVLVTVLVIRCKRRQANEQGNRGCKVGGRTQRSSMQRNRNDNINVYMNVAFDEDRPKKSRGPTAVVKPLHETSASQPDTCSVNTLEEEEEETGEVSVQIRDQGGEEANYYNLDAARPDTSIPVEQLADRVREMEEHPDQADAEFKRLPGEFMNPYDESQRSEYIGKNRFKGYYPYNYNRVVLKDGSKNGDYINASYMDGYDIERYYIASQGPYKPKILVEFWRMIWQEECAVVVMVTGLSESGKMKCLQYWPDEGLKTFGDITVTMNSQTRTADFTITKLGVRRGKDTKQRCVHHFNFTSWPDHGVPEVSALLDFMKRVKITSGQQRHPTIVHCSAGIGRTGTYIAIENLATQATTEGAVDVVSHVCKMRGQRKGMIQTSDQYLFVYRAVSQLVVDGETCVNCDVIRNMDLSHVAGCKMGNKRIGQHLEDLQELQTDNKPKDDFTIVTSYTSRTGFLVMTSDLGTEEVWNRMYNSDASTIITLHGSKVTQSLKFPKKDVPVMTSRLTITLCSTVSLSADVTCHTMTIEPSDNNNATNIHHYHVIGKVASNTVKVLTESLQTWADNSHYSSSMLVSGSLSECRLLILLLNVSSRLQDDGHIDVINNIRRLHGALGGRPFNEKDIRICLQFASTFHGTTGVYGNL